MRDISEVDKNFKIETNIQREGLRFFDIKEPPFVVHGLIRDSGRWTRIPDAVAATVSDSVRALARHTAGGRLRFRTDSPYIAIKALQPHLNLMDHMAPSGQFGFDVYLGAGKDIRYNKTFRTSAYNECGFEAIIDLGLTETETVTVDFPLYYGVDELYIGLKDGSVIEPAPDYSIKKPIVYYGSSITQGGCASRAGTSYQGFISRWLDADYINLGFSGSARGEQEMAEYIAGLDMSAFVLDYDHNAPSVEHLDATHEPFFKTIRKAHPNLPIIVVGRPLIHGFDNIPKRFEIISRTVECARASGDKNVYLINGLELMTECGDEGTVDGTHPTDLGFFFMAKRIATELRKLNL